MNPRTRLLQATCIALLLILVQSANSQQITLDHHDRNQTATAPLAQQMPVFIENKGQWDRQAKFLLRSDGLNMWITDRGVVYDICRIETKDAGSSIAAKSSAITARTVNAVADAKPVVHRTAVFVNFIGAQPTSSAHGSERAAGYHNYFIGSDHSKWVANVPLYSGARIEKLYSGIDAVFYLDEGRPRYDLVVKPGADVAQVAMEFKGAEGVLIDKSGALVIQTNLGEVRQRELYAYQMRNNVREKVHCAFECGKDGVVRFDVGGYDRSRPLIIDPVVVAYSTYLGGSSNDHGLGIGVDESGNAYVAGYTNSTDFPTEDAAQSSFEGVNDAFVTKLTSEGALSYSTYLGGSGSDIGYRIAVDGSGNAYVTGNTQSSDFPTEDAAQPSLAGSQNAFVTKLTSAGTISYSTYLGGSIIDFGYGICVDGSGNAYVTGHTFSTDFPLEDAVQSSLEGSNDAFVTKLTSAGAISYSTYLGGSIIDIGYAIGVDESGNAYVTGTTESTDFPTENAAQSSNAGGYDAFVTKLTSGGAISYSTYLGGSDIDNGQGIGVDGSGNAYVAGTTESTDFPTEDAAQASLEGAKDVFVMKLTSAGALSYSTYLGGSGDDVGRGIGVDGSGNAYVVGTTESTDFPTDDAVQASNAGSSDAFVTKLTGAGALMFSTFLGGSGADVGVGIAVDGIGDVYVAGYTGSTDFPTQDAAQSSSAGGIDAFVTKYQFPHPSVSVTAPNGGESWCAGSSQEITWSSTDIPNVRIELSSDGGSTFATTIVASTASDGSYMWSIPASQAAGTDYRVRISDASDASHNDASDASFTIANDVPVLSVSLSPTTLWPPNNQMQTIAISASVSDNCGGASWVLTSVSGDDGTVAADISAATGSAPTSISLRAKRTGNGNGRTYTLVFTAGDGYNVTTETRYVNVPKNLSRLVTGANRESVELGFSSMALPNPFSRSTAIRFELAGAGAVSVTIYDERGKEVAVVVNGELSGGVHEGVWNGEQSDGTPAASGRYYYSIESGGMSETGTLMLVR